MKDRRDERLRGLLIEKKRRLWGELRDELFRKLGTDYNSQFDMPNDLEDLSVIDHIEDLGLKVSGIKKDELIRIDESLRKIEDGTYGLCEACGSEVDEARLAAEPLALRCLRCQGELEAGEGKKPTL